MMLSAPRTLSICSALGDIDGPQSHSTCIDGHALIQNIGFARIMAD
jgi:hypothetical protein